MVYVLLYTVLSILFHLINFFSTPGMLILNFFGFLFLSMYKRFMYNSLSFAIAHCNFFRTGTALMSIHVTTFKRTNYFLTNSCLTFVRHWKICLLAFAQDLSDLKFIKTGKARCSVSTDLE